MADTIPAPTGLGTSGRQTPSASDGKTAPKSQTTFKVLDVRAVDVTLELEDGRVFVATVGDNIDKDDLKRGRMVSIESDGLDKTDVPKDARVTRILPKE